MRGVPEVETKISISSLLSPKAIDTVKSIPIGALHRLDEKTRRKVIGFIFRLENDHYRFEPEDILTALKVARIGDIKDDEVFAEIVKAIKTLKADIEG